MGIPAKDFYSGNEKFPYKFLMRKDIEHPKPVKANEATGRYLVISKVNCGGLFPFGKLAFLTVRPWRSLKQW